MSEDTIFEIKNTLEKSIKDGLTDLIRQSARSAIESALKAEIEEFMKDLKHLTLEDGKAQIVKNGYHPQRNISTGVGNVEVKVPRIRDRKELKSLLLPAVL